MDSRVFSLDYDWFFRVFARLFNSGLEITPTRRVLVAYAWLSTQVK
jgi:hypothetical protein